MHVQTQAHTQILPGSCADAYGAPRYFYIKPLHAPEYAYATLSLTTHDLNQDAPDGSQNDATLEFRPLETAPESTLRSGSGLGSIVDVCEAIWWWSGRSVRRHASSQTGSQRGRERVRQRWWFYQPTAREPAARPSFAPHLGHQASESSSAQPPPVDFGRQASAVPGQPAAPLRFPSPSSKEKRRERAGTEPTCAEVPRALLQVPFERQDQLRAPTDEICVDALGYGDVLGGMYVIRCDVM